MHLIVKHDGRWVEVQIRTELQHLWAVFSEKVADRFDHSLKYGGGDAAIQARLKFLSDFAYATDVAQDFVDAIEHRDGSSNKVGSGVTRMREKLNEIRPVLANALHEFSENPDSLLDES